MKVEKTHVLNMNKIDFYSTDMLADCYDKNQVLNTTDIDYIYEKD